MRSSLDGWWNAQAPRRARRLRALAVVDYALAIGHRDAAGLQRLRHEVVTAHRDDLPGLIADLPVPRWDRGSAAAPVDGPQRDFAVTLLDIATEAGTLDSAERKWRTVFAQNARTAADLLVLFLDLEPYLRRRSRQEPAMATRLERLAFVPTLVQARGQGTLTRAEFDALVERTAAGEPLDTLRAAMRGKGPIEVPRTTIVPRRRPTERTANEPSPRREAPTPPKQRDKPVPPPKQRDKPVTPSKQRGKQTAASRPATDVDRARIAKHLEHALFEGRLDQGEHAARLVILWSATTTSQLAALVVDLPVPADEPLRDRKPDPHSDNLIAPAHREAVIARIDQAMASGKLTLWEYETRLSMALTAHTYRDLHPAVDDLPPLA